MGNKSTTEYEAQINSTIQTHSVVMYSKGMCPYCVRARALFVKMDVACHIVELEQSPVGVSAALFKLTGMRTVPVIFIGGNLLGGFDSMVRGLKSRKLQRDFAAAHIPFTDIMV